MEHAMTRTYEYNGFTLQVAVESDCRSGPAKRASAHPGYVAVVRICEAGSAVPRLSQLRLGEAGGHAFESEADALNGGYIAARTIVDDLFGQDNADSIVMPLWQSPVTLPSPGVLLSFSERAKRPEKVHPRRV
ncbi:MULTISPECIES: hypothetical protein [Paraburkholderia]|uniref:Uncharacterized protein n=1 Tax=Paraburkholderia madseniana TaxID=2599607 RepID=A0AAP5ER98_9BURK|nr:MULTISPECIES: hypothetical protein [Paraburkholderia]MCX4150045.1 hypothetical protein [Paraburkholderia madseniana]MDN7152981.1 hypothetical protein [Paraburkholderia sp. WS6]MDQ6411863.1 hypothetical protein [Paraburkholderia madseniana]